MMMMMMMMMSVTQRSVSQENALKKAKNPPPFSFSAKL